MVCSPCQLFGGSLFATSFSHVVELYVVTDLVDDLGRCLSIQSWSRMIKVSPRRLALLDVVLDVTSSDSLRKHYNCGNVQWPLLTSILALTQNVHSLMRFLAFKYLIDMIFLMKPTPKAELGAISKLVLEKLLATKNLFDGDRKCGLDTQIAICHPKLFLRKDILKSFAIELI